MGASGDGTGYRRVGDTGGVDRAGAALVMSDKTHTGGGAAIEGDVGTGGGDMVGRDKHQARTDHRVEQLAANVTFQSQDTAVLWQEIRRVNERVGDVRFLLDDLPNRVARLEVQVQPIQVPIPVPIIHPLVWAVITIVAFGVGAYLL